MWKKRKVALCLVILCLLLFVLFRKCAWTLPLTEEETAWCYQHQLQLPDGAEATIDNILPYCVMGETTDYTHATQMSLTFPLLHQFVPEYSQTDGCSLTTSKETGLRTLTVCYSTQQDLEVTLFYFDGDSVQYAIVDKKKDVAYTLAPPDLYSHHKWVNYQNHWRFPLSSSMPPQLPSWLGFLFP